MKVEDREIQAILRHANIGVTQAIYIKSVMKSQVEAMDKLGAELQESPSGDATEPQKDAACNELSTMVASLNNSSG